jgi:hypothetical protein
MKEIEIVNRVNQILKEMYDSRNDYNDYAVNWSDLSVIEIFESKLVYPIISNEFNNKSYLVIISEASPNEKEFSYKVEELYYNKYKENIQVKTEW